MPSQKLYLENLPPGINYPDDDPYIMKLKEKYPGGLGTEKVGRESFRSSRPPQLREYPKLGSYGDERVQGTGNGLRSLFRSMRARFSAIRIAASSLRRRSLLLYQDGLPAALTDWAGHGNQAAQAGEASPVSDLMGRENHIFAVVPRVEAGWRLPVFEAGRYLIAFDGAALLLLELRRAGRVTPAAAPS